MSPNAGYRNRLAAYAPPKQHHGRAYPNHQADDQPEERRMRRKANGELNDQAEKRGLADGD